MLIFQNHDVFKAAVRKSIYEAEEERTRSAYLTQPDLETAEDDWLEAEEWNPKAVRYLVASRRSG